MAVQIGDQAPKVTLLHKAPEGVQKVSIGEATDKNVVLLFFPAVGTSVCTEEMCGVTEDWDSYKSLDADVYGVSVDSPFAQEVWAKANNIAVPLLSDFNKEAITAFDTKYDVWVPGTFDMNGVAKRSAFVINKEGKVIYADILENAGEMPDLQKVKDALQNA